MIVPLICAASTARALGAERHVADAGSCAALHVAGLLKAFPGALVIVAHDLSVWVWRLVPEAVR